MRSRPQRIAEISQRYGLNGEEVLDNILLARAYTHEQQMDIITAAAAKIVEDESPYHLLVLTIISFLPPDCGFHHCAVQSRLQWKRRALGASAEARQTPECPEKTYEFEISIQHSGGRV